MVKSEWVVEIHSYDYFDYDGRYSYRQKSFSSLVEAFAYYKKEKAYDKEWDDYYRTTKIYHFFVYENEDKVREEKRREEKERTTKASDDELKEWMEILASGELRPMTDEEYKASGLEEVSSSPDLSELEYSFNDDYVEF